MAIGGHNTPGMMSGVKSRCCRTLHAALPHNTGWNSLFIFVIINHKRLLPHFHTSTTWYYTFPVTSHLLLSILLSMVLFLLRIMTHCMLYTSNNIYKIWYLLDMCWYKMWILRLCYFLWTLLSWYMVNTKYMRWIFEAIKLALSPLHEDSLCQSFISFIHHSNTSNPCNNCKDVLSPIGSN